VGAKEIFKQADSSMYNDKFERSDLVKRTFIDSLLSLVAEKDFRNEGQEERLRRLVLLLGQAVGMPFQEIRDIVLLSRVHDIGKVGIDESIIFKKEPLTDEDWKEIKTHPEIGSRIARFSPEMSSIADFILQHHESWDGSGYPRGLKGDNIHIYSRIITIIDAYEAMTSPRPYRDPLTHDEAVEELKKNSGIQFDPRLVNIFINLIDQEYLI
jgi:HD-GYP domain-containing protein (c-di-GMP phosphodiesterase class II)